MAIMIARLQDNDGNKAEIEVTEFKTLKEAYKVITELQKEIDKLKDEIKKLKDGTGNS